MNKEKIFRAPATPWSLTTYEPLTLSVPDFDEEARRVGALEREIDFQLASRLISDIPNPLISYIKEERYDLLLRIFESSGTDYSFLEDELNMATQNLNAICFIQAKKLARALCAVDTYAYRKGVFVDEDDVINMLPEFVRAISRPSLDDIENQVNVERLVSAAIRNKTRRMIADESKIIYTHNYLAEERQNINSFYKLIEASEDYLASCDVNLVALATINLF